jgi:hypothetical protein
MTFSIVHSLPARCIPLEGESLVSFLRRSAAVMDYQGPRYLRYLLADIGQLPMNVNSLGPGPLVDQLSILFRRSIDVLLAMTVHSFAPRLALTARDVIPPAVCDLRTALRYFGSTSFPICPPCLAADPVPYECLAWSLHCGIVCREHRCWLISRCPACQKPFRASRLDTVKCQCGASIAGIEPRRCSVSAAQLARQLHSLFLMGEKPIAGMSPAATCWWTERLAVAAARTPAWTEPLRALGEAPQEMPKESIAWLAAAEMVQGWPKRFREFLDVYQEVSKYRITSTGISRRFGLLIREAWQLEKLGFSAPADVLREYLLESYSGGHLSVKVCLFQGDIGKRLLAQNRWITQTEAGRMLGLRPPAIAALVRRGVLSGRVHAAGSRGRSVGVVSKESVELLQAALETTLRVTEAAHRLGIGRHAVLDLVHAGILAQAVRTIGGWKIPESSVQHIENVLSRLPPLDRSDSHWLSLRQATRVFGPAGLTLAAVLQLIEEGKVDARLTMDGKGLNRLVLWQPGLERCRPEGQAEFDRGRGYPLHRVGKVLFANRPVKVDVVKKWIGMRLLKVQRAGRARIVTAEEMERFQATYCLTDEACRILGISRTTLSRWEVEGRVRPVYGKRVTPGAGFSLYRREDIERLKSPESDRPMHTARAA